MSTIIAEPSTIDTDRRSSCPPWCEHDDCNHAGGAYQSPEAPLVEEDEHGARMDMWVEQLVTKGAPVRLGVLHEFPNESDGRWHSEWVKVSARDLRWILALPTEQLDRIRAFLDQVETPVEMLGAFQALDGVNSPC